MGLIPVLMQNGIQHKVSTLVGSESTLRDYVLDYIKYASVMQNSANISFLKSLKSETFTSTPMLSNIKILYNSILSYA